MFKDRCNLATTAGQFLWVWSRSTTYEVTVMEPEVDGNAPISVAFLRQLLARHTEPLTVIWDNSPDQRDHPSP